ncbi:hypothetical protein ACFSYG_17310 [Leeuwenhoekiella polynyae]|uniref:Uncharacterized protein n=1 Tax=Leeuwenhoekiella polynyae TaxID=1550906 RepID=A0A4Q0P6I0_9FLAO|nr:hypothetical protein [Leeuwenhoekiella polynyae]RXG22244.1 hypothetical protein DSM02_1843 [Leeuwenhoekiella polynyae]
MRYFLSLLTCTLLLSCKPDKNLKLSTIEGFPSEIMGCSCYYATSEENFKNQRFIYLDSYEATPAFISIADTLVPVDPKSNTYYKVEFDIEKEVQLDQELFHREGTLKVTAADGSIYTTPIYGECGC